MAGFAEKRYLQLPRPCAGDMRADRERLVTAAGAEISLPAMRMLYPTLHASGYGVTVTLNPGRQGEQIVRVEPGDTTGRLYGLALDIGSTTLEMELVDMHTEKTLASAGCINSQTEFGLNILDRILAVREDPANLETLRRKTLGDIERLIDRVCEESGVPRAEIAGLCIGGNTTMIHLLLGCDPWLVFQNPYCPVFYDPGILSAGELGLDLLCNVFCMPAVANYLGGDITAGLLLTDLDTCEKPSIFLDIGTNGELALGCRDYLLLGAGAAGPALEGFGSRFGMRAEAGAVRHLRIREDGNIELEVIGGGVPAGICGTGIFDLVAQCFLWGWIDGSGRVDTSRCPNWMSVWDEAALRQIPAVVFYQDADKLLYFTEADIREFIRCKAAGHTMVETLLDQCGLTLDDVDKLYLAGGFGTHIDLESAVTVGLYPDMDRSRMIVLGNSSLAGARQTLLHRECLERVKRFTDHAAYLQFGEMEKFPENMVAAQFLPHTDAGRYPSVRRFI